MTTETAASAAVEPLEPGDFVRLDVGIGTKTQQRQTFKVAAVNPDGTFTIAPVGGGRPIRAKRDQIVKADENGTVATLDDGPLFIAPGSVVVLTRPDRFRGYDEGTPLVVTSDRSGGLTLYRLDGTGNHWTGVPYAAVKVIPTGQLGAVFTAAFPASDA